MAARVASLLRALVEGSLRPLAVIGLFMVHECAVGTFLEFIKHRADYLLV